MVGTTAARASGAVQIPLTLHASRITTVSKGQRASLRSSCDRAADGQILRCTATMKLEPRGATLKHAEATQTRQRRRTELPVTVAVMVCGVPCIPAVLPPFGMLTGPGTAGC